MDGSSTLDITLLDQADIPRFKPSHKAKSTKYSVFSSSEAKGVRTDFRFVATPGFSLTSNKRGLEGWRIDGLTERTSLTSRKMVSSKTKLFAIMTGVDEGDIMEIIRKLVTRMGDAEGETRSLRAGSIYRVDSQNETACGTGHKRSISIASSSDASRVSGLGETSEGDADDMPDAGFTRTDTA